MAKKINVLSLFDGMSCCQIALKELGIIPDIYYASEIDKHAIAQTQLNFPNTIQLGSVVNVDVSKLQHIDLLIGGSPCQSFSFAGKRKGMSTKCEIEITKLEQYLELKEQGFEFEGQSYLFWEYMRILTDIRKYNPDVKFFLENVEMGSKWERVLSEAIGLYGVHINSALVSAQNRKGFTGLDKIEKDFIIRKIIVIFVIKNELNMKKRSEEYKIQHREREKNRYWETHKEDKAICVICNKEYLKIERKGTTKTCSEICQKELKKITDKNRDKTKKAEYRKKYYQEHKMELIEYAKNYRKTDSGKLTMKKADSDSLRIVKKKMRTHLRREIGGTTALKMEDLISILNMKPICIVCAAEKNLTIDHIVPLSRMGANEITNLQILCRKCNSKKHDKTMEEFLTYIALELRDKNQCSEKQ